MFCDNAAEQFGGGVLLPVWSEGMGAGCAYDQTNGRAVIGNSRDRREFDQKA